MMRDEVLGPLDDPGEIADTQLAALRKRERDPQPCRVGQRRQLGCLCTCDLLGEPGRTKCLRPWHVETEKLATIVSAREVILTLIATSHRPLVLAAVRYRQGAQARVLMIVAVVL